MGLPYSKTLRIMDLYVIRSVSLSHPHVDPARDFMIFNFFLALVIVCFMCGPKQNMVSKVTPRSLGFLSSLICFSSLVTFGSTGASAVAGVNQVTVDFSGAIRSSLSSRKVAKFFINVVILADSSSTFGPRQHIELVLCPCQHNALSNSSHF